MEEREQRRRDLELSEVDEKGAPAEVQQTYDRIKDTLRVNLVNFVWRVFANRPQFLETVWRELEPAVDQGFMEAADAIRAMAIRRVEESIAIPDHRQYLGDDTARAAEELRVFLEVNPKLLICMCALHHAWNGTPVGGVRKPVKAERGVPEWHPEVHVAGPIDSGRVKDVFDQMVETLDLPSPNTDYRVLAKWPDYLTQSWGDLRGYIGTQAWQAICKSVDWVAEQAAVAIPSQITVSPDRAGEMGLEKEDIDEVGAWIDAFHGLLPGLIVNTSYLWLGMQGGTEQMEAPQPPTREERREREEAEPRNPPELGFERKSR